jgi:hypothetical protein
MSVIRHSDGKLTDKIYTDENLWGTATAIEALPNYMETASQILVVGSQNGLMMH